MLKVGKKTLYWKSWVVAGIVYVGDVFEGDNLMSFQQLATKYRLPRQDFWKYLQLRSCILQQKREFPLSPQTDLQKLMQDNCGAKGGASKYYSYMRKSRPPKLDALKRAWEEDFQSEIVMEGWEGVIRSWHKISRETQTRLIMYKTIHRLYWTPSKMARLKLCDSELCWRCERSKGTFVHMLYECEMAQNLWKKIILFINKVLDTDVSQSPALCILGLINTLEQRWMNRVAL